MQKPTSKLRITFFVLIILVIIAIVSYFGKTIGLQQSANINNLKNKTLSGSSQTASLTNDYAEVIGQAQVDYSRVPTGSVAYCDLDTLQRSQCAYGNLTHSLFLKEQQEDRALITVNPTGWTKNKKVTIPALSNIPESKPYNGWFWNRSHLVADSLGGEPIKENLVTGTRTQNVGSTQTEGEFSGGMAYTERLARNYLKAQKDDSCPLYYAATPQYVNNELIPRTVIVDILDCNGSINMRVKVYNTANEYNIDYHNGSFRHK